jgi:hypothetical protein
MNNDEQGDGCGLAFERCWSASQFWPFCSAWFDIYSCRALTTYQWPKL